MDHIIGTYFNSPFFNEYPVIAKKTLAKELFGWTNKIGNYTTRDEGYQRACFLFMNKLHGYKDMDY